MKNVRLKCQLTAETIYTKHKTQPTAAIHSLPTQHLLSKTLEHLTNQRLRHVIGNHFLGVALHNFNYTWFDVRPELMQLTIDLLVPIVHMFRVCQ